VKDLSFHAALLFANWVWADWGKGETGDKLQQAEREVKEPFLSAEIPANREIYKDFTDVRGPFGF